MYNYMWEVVLLSNDKEEKKKKHCLWASVLVHAVVILSGVVILSLVHINIKLVLSGDFGLAI